MTKLAALTYTKIDLVEYVLKINKKIVDDSYYFVSAKEDYQIVTYNNRKVELSLDEQRKAFKFLLQSEPYTIRVL